MDGKCTIRHLKHSLKIQQSLVGVLQLGICFVFFIFTSPSITAHNDHNGTLSLSSVSHLSAKERRELTPFFHNLFAQEELSYTLFGDKPMSFCFPNTYPPVFSKRNYLFKLYIEGTIPFFHGLETWKKLRESSQNNEYSLILYEEKKYPTFAILINKQAFIKEVDKNIDAFKSVYGKAIDASWVLNKIEEKMIDQDELFNQHLLLGIMLGYGRHSAELFQRRWNLIYGEFRPPLSQKPKDVNKGFTSANGELQYLTEVLQSKPKKFEWYINTFPLFLRVTTVAFAFDPDDPEAQTLIRKYKELHGKLISIFDRDDWLDVVLAKLLA
jgi:hypothetical protein